MGISGCTVWVKEPDLGPMNKDTPSRMLLNTEDDAFKSEAPHGHTKEAVENVGLEPRVEGQL